MATAKTTKATKTTKKKSTLKVADHGRAYVTATFNNTLVSITNDKGDTISWSSSGQRGFKGARKSTPYAASLAVDEAAKRAMDKGLRSVDVFVRGPGSGRDSSLRAIKAVGLSITSISDITPIPHNGPRPKSRRRT